jgi:hypothetical protein
MYILTLVLFSPLQNVQRSCNRRFKEKLPKKKEEEVELSNRRNMYILR